MDADLVFAHQALWRQVPLQANPHAAVHLPVHLHRGGFHRLRHPPRPLQDLLVETIMSKLCMWKRVPPRDLAFSSVTPSCQRVSLIASLCTPIHFQVGIDVWHCLSLSLSVRSVLLQDCSLHDFPDGQDSSRSRFSIVPNRGAVEVCCASLFIKGFFLLK